MRGGFDEVQGFIRAPNADADIEERKRLLQQNETAKSQSSVGLLTPNLAGYEAAMNVSPDLFRRLSGCGCRYGAFIGIREKLNQSQRHRRPSSRAHEEGKQQEGGRLLKAFTAPSLQPTDTKSSRGLMRERVDRVRSGIHSVARPSGAASRRTYSQACGAGRRTRLVRNRGTAPRSVAARKPSTPVRRSADPTTVRRQQSRAS